MVAGVWALAQILIPCTHSMLSFCFSGSQFPHLSKGANKVSLLGRL